jgi:transcriptional regulator with XRE-family HTH domain
MEITPAQVVNSIVLFTTQYVNDFVVYTTQVNGGYYLMNTLENELGLFLEQLRKKRKMSLREAAEKSRLGFTYIRDLELGENRKTKKSIKPSPQTLKQLSEAYNHSYDELMKMAGYIDYDIYQEQSGQLSIVPVGYTAREKFFETTNDLLKLLEMGHDLSVGNHLLTEHEKNTVSKILQQLFEFKYGED